MSLMHGGGGYFCVGFENKKLCSVSWYAIITVLIKYNYGVKIMTEPKNEKLDFIIICFNDSHRCDSSEDTVSTAIQPLTLDCEKILHRLAKNVGTPQAIVNGVFLGSQEAAGDLIGELEINGFDNHMTKFVDTIITEASND